MASFHSRVIRFNESDNVAIAVGGLPAGTAIDNGSVHAMEPIAAGHKIAVRNIEAEAPVVKYGQIIGFASRDITAGQHVHDHNVIVGQFQRDYAIGMGFRPVDYISETQRAQFNGIARPNGQVATRNFIGVLSTVSCSSSVARFIANEMMDINCGRIIDGAADVEEMGRTIFQRILDAASGRRVKSEQYGYGEAEFVPWSIGAVM